MPSRSCGEPSVEQLEERQPFLAATNFAGEGADMLADRAEDRRGVMAFVASLGFLFLRLTVHACSIKKSRCELAIPFVHSRNEQVEIFYKSTTVNMARCKPRGVTGKFTSLID